MTAKSGAAAAAKSLTLSAGYGGECLRFVRTVWNVHAKYIDAKTAWAKAKKKHNGLRGIPVGAPLFMSHPKSVHGHVVIWLGNNKVRSTNSATNRIATYDLETWTKSWGYKVQGWVEDLNGVELPIKSTVHPKPKPVGPIILERGDSGVRVRKLQEEYNTHFPAYSHLVVDSFFGPKTEDVTEEFQRRTGLPPTGKIDETTKKKLNYYGIRF